MMKHKNYKNVWEFPEDFPSVEIIEAFTSPRVKDVSSLKFESPDLKTLASICENILRLNPHEIEFIIEPLEIEYEKRRTHSKITDFFQRGPKYASIVSTRLQDSVGVLLKNKKGISAIQTKPQERPEVPEKE